MFDVLDDLEDAIEKVLASVPTGGDVERISRLADQLEFARLREIAAFDRDHGFLEDNSLSAAAGLRHKTRCSHGRSAQSVRLARKLGRLHEVAAAFAAGEITREHAEVIAKPYTTARAGMIENVEHELVVAARIATVAELQKKIHDLIDAHDGGRRRDRRNHGLNKLTLSSTLGDRGVLNGSLDPEMTEIVKTAFDAEMELLRQKGETRTTPQLRADALASICRWYAASRANSGARGRGQTHVGVIVDVAKYEDELPDLVATVRAEYAHGGSLTRSTLERISCDCKISRVIMDGPGRVLDVGRTTRTVSNAQWNALVARDQHCTEPGCTLGPGFCEAHHIQHWEHGGPTNLDNLRLLCWTHHRRHHVHDAKNGAG